MKKLFFIFTVLFSLVNNSFAQSATPAYFYDIYVASSQNGYVWDNGGSTYSTSTKDDHGGDVYIAVLVRGCASYLVTTFNNSPLTTAWIESYDTNHDSYIDTWIYYYHINNNQGMIQTSDNGLKDSIYMR